MGSSIFDGCQDMFPETRYVEGDKKFEELQPGDSMFRYDGCTGGFHKYEVTKGFHRMDINGVSKVVISLRNPDDKRKRLYVDFGSGYNQRIESCGDKSIVIINRDIYGTCAKSVIADRKRSVQTALDEYVRAANAELALIEQYEKMG